ncbi:MAG: hypothetical protein AB1485_03890 [Candidatus Thermoplasmatota archaeon]
MVEEETVGVFSWEKKRERERREKSRKKGKKTVGCLPLCLEKKENLQGKKKEKGKGEKSKKSAGICKANSVAKKREEGRSGAVGFAS